MTAVLALAFAAAWAVIAAVALGYGIAVALEWLGAHTTLPRWAQVVLVLWTLAALAGIAKLWAVRSAEPHSGGASEVRRIGRHPGNRARLDFGAGEETPGAEVGTAALSGERVDPVAQPTTARLTIPGGVPRAALRSARVGGRA